MIMEGWTNKLALATDGPTAGVAVWVGSSGGGRRPPGHEIHPLGAKCTG